MYGSEYMHDFGWGGLMGFITVVFWIVTIIVAYVVIRNISSKAGGASSETPLDILKKRYARGEISRDEFERMKNDLTS